MPSFFASWQNTLLAIAAISFAASLLWKLRPVIGTLGGPAPGEDVRRAKERARRATTPRERAEALLSAGDASSFDEAHTTSAIGYYLRAMRSDPTWEEPLLALKRLLEVQQPNVLEGILWRKLAHVDWQGSAGPAAACSARLLGELYASKIKDRDRAQVMHKVERLLRSRTTH